MDINPVSVARAVGFMAGVLEAQRKDPYCVVCKSYGKTVERVRESLPVVDKALEGATLPDNITGYYKKSRACLDEVKSPPEPVAQRKEGKCAFPDKKCYLKQVRKFYDKTLNIEEDKESTHER